MSCQSLEHTYLLYDSGPSCTHSVFLASPTHSVFLASPRLSGFHSNVTSSETPSITNSLERFPQLCAYLWVLSFLKVLKFCSYIFASLCMCFFASFFSSRLRARGEKPSCSSCTSLYLVQREMLGLFRPLPLTLCTPCCLHPGLVMTSTAFPDAFHCC